MQVRRHGSGSDTDKDGKKKKTVPLHFLRPDGSKQTVKARFGESVLEVAHRHKIPIEGACEGSLACSTCHVILEEKLYDALEEPVEEEEDMLDLAPELTDTSRLGCQLIIDEKYTNAVVKLPAHTLNFYVDGHEPTPH